MAWMGATPVGSGSVVKLLSIRLAVGWMGLFIAVGFGVAGILSWPFHSHLAPREQERSISAYDGVTGLPTRRLYLVLLRQALSRVEATMRNVAVLMCVLEQFRPMSTSSVAPNMNLVVRIQAARIRSAVRPHDVVARLGEFTFAVIADNLESPDEARLIGEKIQHAIALPLTIEGQELLASCRIGGVLGPRHGITAESLLGAAAEVLEKGCSGEEGNVLIPTTSLSWSTRYDANLFSPVSGRDDVPLISHR
jgi:diguanylate cyclase (GGDEF)-like protein